MSHVDTAGHPAIIRAENIGGIEQTEVEVPPGVTVLVGRNATNRTSFLQAIMTALGSTNVSLKGDADRGQAALQIGEECYERQVCRQGGSVSFSGSAYLDDPELADLFAFLLESNPARRAVVQQQELRELIMQPVDTKAIQTEIERLERERDAVDDELDELSRLKADLPSLERRKQDLDDEIEQLRAELAATESTLESMDGTVSKSRAEDDQLEAKLAELRDLRSELDSTRGEIEIQSESIESLQRDLAELQTEREELSDASTDDGSALAEKISRLRQRRQQLESAVNSLQEVVQFNEAMLDGEERAIRDAIETDETVNLTDQLVTGEQTVCWTCGSSVERRRIEETLDSIRDVRQDRMSELRETERELEAVREKKARREEQANRRERLDRKMTDINTEIDRRESQLESLRSRRTELTEAIAAVEEDIDALESDRNSELLRVHREANELEYELGQLESEQADVTDKIDSIESRLAEEAQLERQREQLGDALETKRTEVDRIEREAVEEFNSRMDEILEILGYENLSRIWIERVQTTGADGRRTVEKTSFELHVVRTTSSGATYEDTIEHLSESEREVTGLTFALAGYLVHDLHETIPFILLDSLEAIDSDRLAELVAYFGEYSRYLVVALLPEDAQALPEEYTRITDI